MLKILCAISVLFLSACNTTLLGSYGENHESLSAFAQRVENVFKFQNSMTNAIMLMDTEVPSDILFAETKMNSACEPLNLYASREIDGLTVDFSLQKRVEQTAVSCEKAAQQLQTLLSRVK